MKHGDQALKTAIEIQVPAAGGLDAVIHELETVLACLKLGNRGVVSVDGFAGYRFQTEDCKAGATDFPEEGLELAGPQ